MLAHRSKVVHRVPARSSNQSRPPWNRLRELHRVPARSSNQLPWNPWLCIEYRPAAPTRSPGIHRENCIESRPAGDCCCWPGPRGSLDGTPTRSHRIQGCAYVHPRFADVCIRSPHVCRRLHTFTPCLQTSAYFWPMDPRLCILLAHESMVVHTSGPGIHGCASCWPGPR